MSLLYFSHMSDEKPLEPKKPDAPKDEFVYARDHGKSLRQISQESAKRVEGSKEETIKEKLKEAAKPKEEVKEEPKKEEKKIEEPKVNPDEITKKAVDEAKKQAEEVSRRAFKDEMQKILDKDKEVIDKQKDADDLISVWDREKRLPKDYKEVVQETLRISEAKYKQLERERSEKQRVEKDELKKQEDIKKTNEKINYQTRLDEINNKVKSELNELYEMKHLSRPPETYDEKDETQKKTDDLIKFGIDLNVKRQKENLPPIDSIAKIYFMHYKPFKDAEGAPKTDQPAGADAPISGASSPKTESTTKGYVYARDHGKSYRQILIDNMQRQRKS